MHDLIYIAGPFFKPEQKAVIQQIETFLDNKEMKYFSPREYGVLLDGKMTSERIKRIFAMNVRMIEACNTMIAVTDDFDPGTMFEMGAFHTQQVTFGYEDTMLVTYSPKEYGANVMIAEAAFTHARSMQELEHALNGHEIDQLEAVE